MPADRSVLRWCRVASSVIPVITLGIRAVLLVPCFFPASEREMYTQLCHIEQLYDHVSTKG